MTTNNKGLFIVIEGPDGSGKTTLAQKLAQRLSQLDKKHHVLITREPTNLYVDMNENMKLLESQKLSTEKKNNKIMKLFVYDRMQHITKMIKPSLDAGVHVICDRYILSTLAYQTVQGIDKSEIYRAHNNSWYIKPDIIFYLDCSINTIIKRIKSRNDDNQKTHENKRILESLFEDDSFQRKVHDRYNEILNDEFWITNYNIQVKESASYTPDQLTDQCLDDLKDLSSKSRKEEETKKNAYISFCACCHCNEDMISGTTEPCNYCGEIFCDDCTYKCQHEDCRVTCLDHDGYGCNERKIHHQSDTISSYVKCDICKKTQNETCLVDCENNLCLTSYCWEHYDNNMEHCIELDQNSDYYNHYINLCKHCQQNNKPNNQMEITLQSPP